MICLVFHTLESLLFPGAEKARIAFMKRLEVGPFRCIGCNRPAPVSLASEWLGRFPMYRWGAMRQGKKINFPARPDWSVQSVGGYLRATPQAMRVLRARQHLPKRLHARSAAGLYGF